MNIGYDLVVLSTRVLGCRKLFEVLMEFRFSFFFFLLLFFSVFFNFFYFFYFVQEPLIPLRTRQPEDIHVRSHWGAGSFGCQSTYKGSDEHDADRPNSKQTCVASPPRSSGKPRS